VRTIADALRERQADVGFIMGMDCRICRIVDERGFELTSEESSALLTLVLDETNTPVGSRAHSPLKSVLQPKLEQSDLSEAELIRFQREHQLPLLADGQGRYWFLRENPQCDAILTIAKILQALSLSERPMSAYRRLKERPERSRR
jgi:hypothetical protein